MLLAEGFLLSFSTIFVLLLFLATRNPQLSVLLTGGLYLLLLLCWFQPLPESLAQKVLKPRGKVYSIAHRGGGGAAQHDAPENTLAAIRLLSRAEPIRLLLADQGASWTDEVVQFADWFGAKSELEQQAVFGQLPKFNDGDFVLYQTNSILRYLARKYGISGGSNQESALIDMVNDGVEEFKQKLSRFFKFEFETGKEKFESELPKDLAAFERILCKNSNGTKYLVGDKISYADYNLLDILQGHLYLYPECLSSFPLLTAFIDRISSRPKLSEYLKSEARINRPVVPKK